MTRLLQMPRLLLAGSKAGDGKRLVQRPQGISSAPIGWLGVLLCGRQDVARRWLLVRLWRQLLLRGSRARVGPP